jgi:hypothetical protein
MVASDVIAAKATVEPSIGRPSRNAASTITQVEATGVLDMSLTRASHLQTMSQHSSGMSAIALLGLCTAMSLTNSYGGCC